MDRTQRKFNERDIHIVASACSCCSFGCHSTANQSIFPDGKTEKIYYSSLSSQGHRIRGKIDETHSHRQ